HGSSFATYTQTLSGDTLLAGAFDRGSLVINPLILAELSVRFASEQQRDAALMPLGLVREHLPFEASFSAAQAFTDYRRRGGSRTGVLPDFYIGAHAHVAGYTLLTRDARRYRTAFRGLDVIAPDTHG
ncbi:MAG: type II toxin-antitoxin system VapC family toxin, partial [Microbacterium sp.]